MDHFPSTELKRKKIQRSNRTKTTMATTDQTTTTTTSTPLHDVQLKLDEELFKTVYPSEYYHQYIQKNIRPDKRSLLGIRKTTVSVGSITSANGSAFVKQGNTSVSAGIKLEYGPPPPPGVSQLMISLELLPLCSSRFRPGKPSEQAQVVGEQISRLFNKYVQTLTTVTYPTSNSTSFVPSEEIDCFSPSPLSCSLIALLTLQSLLPLPPQQSWTCANGSTCY